MNKILKGNVDQFIIKIENELFRCQQIEKLISPQLHTWCVKNDPKTCCEFRFDIGIRCVFTDLTSSFLTKYHKTLKRYVLYTKRSLLLTSKILGFYPISISLVRKFSYENFKLLNQDLNGYPRNLLSILHYKFLSLCYFLFYFRRLPQRDYTSGFILAFIMFMLSIISGALIKFVIEKKDEKTEGTMGNVLGNCQVILFLACVLEVGASQGCIMTFFFMLMEDVALSWDPHFQDINLLQGLTLTIGCFCGEVPSMFFSGYIIKKLGNFLTFVVVLIVYSIRFTLHSFVSNPWYFLPIEVLHGISFGLLYPNMSAYASKVAPPGRKATMQGVVKSVYAAGNSVGSLVGGVIFKFLGGSQLFYLLGILNAGFLGIFVLIQIILNRTHQTTVTEEEAEEAFLPNQTNNVQLKGVNVPPENKEP
ncbi:unnamed protein product, partial [Meganyctiphanes norvegica]